MNDHGFSHLELSFTNTKTALGTCVFRYGTPVRITLSKPWVIELDEAEVKDTILHEIAHAIAGHEAGHGLKWKAACQTIGANPYRLARLDSKLVKDVKQKLSKYHAVCADPLCDTEVYFDRFTKNWQHGVYRCGKCKSKLIVSENPAAKK